MNDDAAVRKPMWVHAFFPYIGAVLCASITYFKYGLNGFNLLWCQFTVTAVFIITCCLLSLLSLLWYLLRYCTWSTNPKSQNTSFLSNRYDKFGIMAHLLTGLLPAIIIFVIWIT